MSDFYIDPDYTGSVRDGQSGTPWQSLEDTVTNTPWNVINTELASNPVNVYCAARKASSDIDQTSSMGIGSGSTSRTNTSTNRLTFNGYSRYNQTSGSSTPSWVAYTGSSKFTITRPDPLWFRLFGSLTGNNGYITVQGFGLISNTSGGSACNITYANHLIIEDCLISRTVAARGGGGGGYAAYLQYAHRFLEGTEGIRNNSVDDGPDTVNNYDFNGGLVDITFRRNVIEFSNAETMYVGGSESWNADAHDGVIIEYNIFRNTCSGGGGELDGLDIKNRIKNLIVRFNTIHDVHKDALPTLNGGLYEGNKIYNFGNAGIFFSTNLFTDLGTTRANTVVRNNSISNGLNTAGAGYPAGITIDVAGPGTSRYTNAAFYNNSVYDIVGGPGYKLQDGGSSIKMRNNVGFKTDGDVFTATTGVLDAANHDHNLYYKVGGGTVAVYGSNSYDAANIASFEANSKSEDPLFVDPDNNNLALQGTSVCKDTGFNLASTGFSNDILGAVRPQGSGWDRGAYEVSDSPPPVVPTSPGRVVVYPRHVKRRGKKR